MLRVILPRGYDSVLTFETLLSEELRQNVARRTEANLAGAIENVYQPGEDDTTPKPELALAAATTTNMHAAQGLKEKMMVGLTAQLLYTRLS